MDDEWKKQLREAQNKATAEAQDAEMRRLNARLMETHVAPKLRRGVSVLLMRPRRLSLYGIPASKYVLAHRHEFDLYIREYGIGMSSKYFAPVMLLIPRRDPAIVCKACDGRGWHYVGDTYLYDSYKPCLKCRAKGRVRFAIPNGGTKHERHEAQVSKKGTKGARKAKKG